VLSGIVRRYATGILPRYVIRQVFQSFALALVTITAVFVLIMVMTEATRSLLGPREILKLVPLIVPVTLTYTVPVAMLFAVSVVYGRLASDNEVIAVKAAGLGVMMLLLPTILLGLALSGLLFLGANGLIPAANREAKVRVFKSIESVFFKALKRDRVFNNANWPFYIAVHDVQGSTLINVDFKHRKGRDDPDNYDMRIFARRATMYFDPAARLVNIDLEGAEFSGENQGGHLHGQRLTFPFKPVSLDPRVQELTGPQILAKQVERRRQIDTERARQASAAGLWIASGRIGRVNWPEIQTAFVDYDFWRHDLDELETEKHMRIALAFGPFFFVLLGAPVGILFAKRDFLSAFISCFLPIILAYYPLTLLGMNLGKDGNAPATIVFAGDLTLGVLAGLVLRPVLKH